MDELMHLYVIHSGYAIILIVRYDLDVALLEQVIYDLDIIDFNVVEAYREV